MCRVPQPGIFGHVTGRYDVINAGSVCGGGHAAHTLASSGKRILLLERGDFLPREIGNWDPGPVFVDGRYISPEPWFDADGKAFQPQVHYYVGGATKLYGAALYRLRPEDFGEIQHADGPSPASPLSYDDFEPVVHQGRVAVPGPRRQVKIPPRATTRRNIPGRRSPTNRGSRRSPTRWRPAATIRSMRRAASC